MFFSPSGTIFLISLSAITSTSIFQYLLGYKLNTFVFTSGFFSFDDIVYNDFGYYSHEETIVLVYCSYFFSILLSKVYEQKVDVINVITAPEIEMLIIFNEDKYKEFKKSGKKPSDFCKEDLKMTSVKSYRFVKDYFSDPDILLTSIKKYHEISKIRKGEYTLLDLLKI